MRTNVTGLNGHRVAAVIGAAVALWFLLNWLVPG